ncbi:response regulator [Lachnospira multipara]|uniref:response regulator n=1 Tax=Lachnospira multipara TaxID=28051 RepID=UPI0004E24EB4|nr:response regulator [Lachnospira multipara]
MLEFLLRHDEAHIQASAIVFDIILILFSNVQVKNNKLGISFRNLLYCGTFLTIIETTLSWLEDLPNCALSFYVINSLNMLVYLLIITLGFGLAAYFELSFGSFNNKKIWTFNLIVFIAYIVILIINIFTDCISIFNLDTKLYSHGPLFYTVGVLFPVYSYGFCLFIYIRNFKNISTRIRPALSLTFLIIVVGIVFQPLVNGKITITGLLISIGMFILYMTVETHDYMQLIEANQKLLIAKEEAYNANKSKSAFLANMSHEIRTPLNAFLGLNDLIIEESMDFETLELAENIKSAGNALLSIINEILDISKIETGKIEIKNTPYNLGDIIRDIDVIIRTRAKDKGIPFIMDIDENLPNELIGDVAKIRQVIINVLNNSVKYTSSGAIVFTLRGSVQNNTLLLKMQIFDTGMGIKKEDLSHLFESYRRVDLKKNVNIEGTGLGLSIVKQSIDMMGGSISVRSNYGLGTCFYMEILQTIKSYETVHEYLHMQKQNGISRITDSFTTPNANILIVDDNDMNIKVACGFLKSTKANLFTANGGPEGLDLLENNKYDIVFLDSFMPIIDGTQILKKIRSNPKNINYNTPIIVLTADALSGSKKKYLDQGFNDYLSKPVNASRLKEKLIKFLPKELIDLTNTTVKDNNLSTPKNIIKNEIVMPKLNNHPDNLVNWKEGLNLCRGNKTLYRELLDEFIRIKPEKRLEINNAFEKQDWDSYNILTHSLKSNAKTIGANLLSDAAMEMEYASRAILAGENINSNVAFIKEKHRILLKLYDDVQEELLWISF